MESLIFSVKRYSIHDGPGIRVTFFMKGCPLSCWWCHNPEGISSEPQIVEENEKVGEREFRVQKQAGKFYTVKEILSILDQERIFILQSHGGVTFSGGEPMMQTGFLTEALKACKEAGYHTAVDTSGYSQPENFLQVMPYTDLFLFDIKLTDDQKHVQYTGVSNSLIMDNLRMILGSGKDVIIRIPVVPGINDDSENITKLKFLLQEIRTENLRKISLLPYHKIGKAKYARFGIPYRMNGFEPPSALEMKELKKYFEETGIKVKTGG